MGRERRVSGGPDVLLLADDVLVQLGKEDGHLVVQMVVLFHHTTALLASAVSIHLGGGGDDDPQL